MELSATLAVARQVSRSYGPVDKAVLSPVPGLTAKLHAHRPTAGLTAMAIPFALAVRPPKPKTQRLPVSILETPRLPEPAPLVVAAIAQVIAKLEIGKQVISAFPGVKLIGATEVAVSPIRIPTELPFSPLKKVRLKVIAIPMPVKE